MLVDEAATAATPKLTELARLAANTPGRFILVGDPRQFTVVGRGGMFAHLVNLHGSLRTD